MTKSISSDKSWKSLSYKQMVSSCLNTLVAKGMTHAEIGRAMADEDGPLRGNVVTMHLNPENPITPFPLARLPRLAEAVGLKPIDCLRLARQRSKDHPEAATAVDQKTFDWVLSNTVKSVRRGAKREH